MLLLAALFGAGQTATSLPPAAARQALLAAEDRRLALPDDVPAPGIELLRARQADDMRTAVELARSPDPQTRRMAIRTLGRYERRDLTNEILQYLPSGPPADVAFALAQSLQGEPLPGDESGEQVRTVFEALALHGERENTALGAIARAVGRLPYVSAGQVQAADRFLARAFARVEPDARLQPTLTDLAAASESLARRHGRLSPPGDDTVTWLDRIASSLQTRYAPSARVAAMQALVASRRVEPELLRMAARAASIPDLRRLAAISLGSDSSSIASTERTDLLINLLGDSDSSVRLEAMRAWIRQESATNGCERIVDRIDDANHHVRLTAIDLLGESCTADVNVTARLATEARTPPAAAWHREAHALVALARRAPDRIAVAITSFVEHPRWQVRMYAARAAAIAGNVPVLERLARDPEDNVREATLGALKRLKGPEAEPQFLAALLRRDYQLLRTAANELEGLPPGPALAGALADALTRVTADRRETSRDARLALLERIGELGDENQASALVPLLRDYDIPVAVAAARMLQAWTGKPHEIDPQLLPRPPLPSGAELREAADARIEVRLGDGSDFDMTLLPSEAPLTSVRFLRLLKSGYYNGLTFHRVVPNFVIQGGSPGANEYMGDDIYTRDEISPLSHHAGTIGLSTRGRDTGDMQFFANLVHNPRLDYEYTVFGRVIPEDLPLLDMVVEGTRIAGLEIKKPEEDKK